MVVHTLSRSLARASYNWLMSSHSTRFEIVFHLPTIYFLQFYYYTREYNTATNSEQKIKLKLVHIYTQQLHSNYSLCDAENIDETTQSPMRSITSWTEFVYSSHYVCRLMELNTKTIPTFSNQNTRTSSPQPPQQQPPTYSRKSLE